MGFMSIFSRKKEAASGTNESLKKIQDTEEMLQKKQEFLERKIEQELLTAKKHGTANKRMALQALKRKQQYQKQLAQIDGSLNTLQHQHSTLLNAHTNSEILKVLAQTSKALKLAHNNMDVDKVHDLIEDIAEQQEVANEIAEAISNPVGLQLGDDDELLAELEQMEMEDLDQKLLNVGPTPLAGNKLPAVPATAESAKTTKKEDEELGELAAWAAM
ncbi:Charged multivesicular body protein 4b [Aphelenchoides fujianensis]|nr:Charged multivesicular body protein 4b [Aphelenchoides fujianensis]